MTMCALLFCASLTAQKKKVIQLPDFDKRPLYWGFYLGLNTINYKLSMSVVDPYYKDGKNYERNTTITIDNKPGFNVGLIGGFKLRDNIDLHFEPGLYSNASTIQYQPEIETEKREISSTFLHIPILLKISTNRLNNIRPYFVGGVAYDHNFSSNQENGDDNSAQQFRMKTHNFMYEIGFGMDFYFPYFKFSPSIRGLFAINNELHPDNPTPGGSPWTDPIDYMGTRGLFLKLAFE